MGDLTDLLLNGIVEFPDAAPPASFLNWFPFIGLLVYALIGAMYGGGVVAYGVAIMFFTVLLKLILLPIDFANRYFTKKNSNFMQKMKPEQDALKEQYADNPLQLNRATQELYKKHGYKMGGFCLFMFINLFVTMAIFMSVFTTLRYIADYNTELQATSLQAVYQEFEYGDYFTQADIDTVNNPYSTPEDVAQAFYNIANTTRTDGTTFAEAVNIAYNNHRVGFLWIRNIWVSDVPWSSSATFSQGLFRSVATAPEGYYGNARNAYLDAQFNIINHVLDHDTNQRSWNGMLLLIILAGITSWGAAYINGKIMMNKKKDDKPKEAVIKYSMRETKNQADQKIPTVDPVVMQRVMKIVLPAIMVYFTMISTAALAIYIVVNSLLSTAITVGLNYPVDKLLKWQEQKKLAKGGDGMPETDGNVINPHAKYFKSKRKEK